MTGRWIRAATGLAAALALAACLPAVGPAKKTSGNNPVTGSEIEVTELDPAPGAPAAKAVPRTVAKAPPKPGQAPAAGPEAPPTKPAAPEVKPKPRPPEGAPETGPEAAEEDTAAPQAPPAAPAVAEAEKTKAQIACEKKKGVWADAGNGLRACVTYTKDAGKSCRKGGDCEGECLARSATCAPFKPLFGCNEVLDEAGRRMTLCLD